MMNERRNPAPAGSIRYRNLLSILIIGLVASLGMTLVAVQTTYEQSLLDSQMAVQALENQAKAYQGMGATIETADVLLATTSLQTQLEHSSRALVANRVLPIAALIFILVVILGLIVSRLLVKPIRKLTTAAQEVAAGQWNVEIPIIGTDEVSQLGHAFASLSAQLRAQSEELESRVESRTRDLSRKAAQLEAASEVAREAAAIRDLDQMLEHVTQLISVKFGYYHVAIFLLDEAREFAVLRSASSDGGRSMLARGYRLKVGEMGIVGFVAGRTRPRIVFDIGEDAVYFHNPDLPLTRSEMAIPLKSQERVIGVLDVHSVEASAFSNDDIDILQMLADQIALPAGASR